MTTEASETRPGDGEGAAKAVGQGIAAPQGAWTFGGNVADTFEEHLSRSVPLYRLTCQRTCQISDYFLCRNGALCYEMGVSSGEIIIKLAAHHATKPFSMRFIGIDHEPPMIQKARERCKDLPSVTLELADIVGYPFQPADFIVSFYTMQFIPPAVRQDVFNAIYQALRWGGGFVLVERVRAPDARFQDMMRTLYEYDFKLEQGFTPEEIVAKTRSLKGVMEPFTSEANFDLLKRAGFVDMMTFIKDVGIEGILAIK